MDDPLATYLHDHLAGADFAIDLLQSMKDRQQDGSLRDFAGKLLEQVREDQAELQQLANQIGPGSNVLKEVASWLSEKASRAKLGAGAAGPFETFEALEFLVTGIHGKLCLWRALRAAAVSDPRLANLDYERLIARADTQHAEAEERRLAASGALRRPVKEPR
jgi:hypothetical protein